MRTQWVLVGTLDTAKPTEEHLMTAVIVREILQTWVEQIK